MCLLSPSWLLCWSTIAALRSFPLGVVAEIIPGVLERVVLAPNAPHHITVGVGQAKFLGFSCMGGPADIVITLSTFAERADPLLFLSLNPDEQPTFERHDASSFGQWREDSSGDHYIVANGINPKGGILGLVNLRHFAGEELDGILRITCTFIVAFDTLFWDHLRNSAVCPIGNHFEDGQLVAPQGFCSAHGQCGKNGLCDCDGDYTGAACEHDKTDIVVAADGHKRFKVMTGRYQYFRVRIPPRFPGGYLAVKVVSELPLVVLVKSDDLPTKGDFETSNFDDWINQRSWTELKFKIASSDDVMDMPPMPPPEVLGSATPPEARPKLQPPPMPSMTGLTTGSSSGYIKNSFNDSMPIVGGRRLLDSLRGSGAVNSWNAFFERAQEAGDGEEFPELPVRRLESDASWMAKCPKISPSSSPACQTQDFQNCQSSCERCMGCVKGGHDGEPDQGCTQACDTCVSPGCMTTLAECAANLSCMGDDAMMCEAGCGSCMVCFDSNDDKCTGCSCCISCLPLAAKCSISQWTPSPTPVTRFAFVGIYNHRRFYNDQDVVAASADISLVEDPSYSLTELPPSWIAELYDQFHDIRNLQITQSAFYPNGEQFVYQLKAGPMEKTTQVKLFRDRLTLLRIDDTALTNQVILRFEGGPEILHMLSSSAAAPKTFFDFDQKHETKNGAVKVNTRGSTVMWFALFSAKDGYTQLKLNIIEQQQQAPAIGFGLVCVFGLLCALLVLGVIYGGAQKVGDFLGMDPNIPLMERLGCLVRNVNPHESTASLTRAGSLSGYIGSDVIDRSVEDQYLHRGGTGDDGI